MTGNSDITRLGKGCRPSGSFRAQVSALRTSATRARWALGWCDRSADFTALVIRSAKRERAHPVRGKDRSPPDRNNSFSRTNFLPINCGPRAYERKFVMPVRRLPSNPNLDHLKYQAKDLLKEHAAHTPGVAQRIREFHPRFGQATDAEIFDAHLSLSDAQLAIAREHGFPSWARLKAHIERPVLSDQLTLPHHERIEDPTFRRAVELLDAGDVANLRVHLNQHPNLVHQHVIFEGGNYFRRPTLLEFIAENPVRHGTMPDNIVQVAQVILDAGVEQPALNETLILVSTGTVPRECGKQLPLMDLLCDHGAEPKIALHAAALHSELEALNALIKRGA